VVLSQYSISVCLTLKHRNRIQRRFTRGSLCIINTLAVCLHPRVRQYHPTMQLVGFVIVVVAVALFKRTISTCGDDDANASGWIHS
jgi:hypothetical protein